MFTNTSRPLHPPVSVGVWTSDIPSASRDKWGCVDIVGYYSLLFLGTVMCCVLCTVRAWCRNSQFAKLSLNFGNSILVCSHTLSLRYFISTFRWSIYLVVTDHIHTTQQTLYTKTYFSTVSPGNIYRTNVPYHIPCHILFPPHRAIIPYHRHTISHTCLLYTSDAADE